MQGLALRGIYPYQYDSTVLCDEDKWVYLNHVSDYITTCDEVTVNYDSEVSTGLIIDFDPSTYIGYEQPIFIVDVSVEDSSCSLYTFTIDFSIADVSISPTDASITYDTSTFVIDGSVVNWRDIYDCSIIDSSISNSNIYDSSIYFSLVGSSYILSNIISDSSVSNSGIVNTPIVNSYVNPSQIENSDVSTSVIKDTLLNDSRIFGSLIQDSSFKGTLVTSTAPLPTGELVYYSFDNSIGDATKEPSAWVPTFVNGVDGSALQFDSSGYLQTSYTNPESFTVAFWYKDEGQTTQNVVFGMSGVGGFSSNEKVRIAVNSAGEIYPIITTAGVPTIGMATLINDASFHFIVLSYDQAGKTYFYVDDVDTDVWDSSFGSLNLNSTSFNTIGAEYGEDSQDAISGVVDEFILFDRVLTNYERRGLKQIGGGVNDASIVGSYASDSSLNNLYLNQSYVKESVLIDVDIVGSKVYESNIVSSTITDSSILGDPSTKTISGSTINDSWVINYIINSGTGYNSYFRNTSVAYIDASSSIFDDASLWSSSITRSDLLCSEVKDSSVLSSYVANSDVSKGELQDSSVYGSLLIDVSIANSKLQDTSIYESNLSLVKTENAAIGQSVAVDSQFSDTKFGETTISDSSIVNDSILNNSTICSSS
jgi:uncharacterized protein YjbI with pentapeptide repeats